MGKSPNSGARQERIKKHGYDTKYAMHIIRLQVLRNTLDGAYSKNEFIEWAKDLMSTFDTLSTSLPKEPNYELVEKLLIETYRENLWNSY